MCTETTACRSHHEFWTAMLALACGYRLTPIQHERLILEILRGHIAKMSMYDITDAVLRMTSAEKLPPAGSAEAWDLVRDFISSVISTSSVCHSAFTNLADDIRTHGALSVVQIAHDDAIAGKAITEEVH